MPPVVDQIRVMLDDVPHEVAYRFLDSGTLTFRDWDEHANRVARGLLESGLRRGDRVAHLLDPADAQMFFLTYVGVHKAGGVNVPLNPRLAVPEIESVLGHCEPSVIFASAAHLATAAKAKPPSVTALVSAGAADRVADVGDHIGWEEFTAADASEVRVDVSDDAIADIIYTSGTTGRPKGVVIRHRAGTPIPVDKPEWNGMSWFHASPFFTFAGLSFLFVPMRLGMRGLYMPRFDPEAFLDLVEQKRIQMCFLVPSMVELLTARDDFTTRDLSALFMVTVGSAPIAPATLLKLQQQAPQAMISNSYGMTEAGSAHMALPKGELEKRPGSVGQPLPPVEVRVIDPLGNALPAGEVGEVLLRNLGREREYYRDAQATAETWRDGWLHTGDLGKLDGDGYLYIVGRIKDVIIRGGMNVHAADVEAALYEHDGVQEAAVIGVPHNVLGEDIAAAVVPRVGVRLDPEELRSWCAGRLADFKVPRRIEVVDALPRNATGKVVKRELRELLVAR